LNAQAVNDVIGQMKKLQSTHQFGIVVGGGNFWRGSIQGASLGMQASVGHQVGMLATMMNGLILKDLIAQQGLNPELLSAVPCPEVGASISQQAIDRALHENQVLIFSGGTGNPFFTTDTTAVLRGLQMKAHEIWKGTSVDGVYDSDPRNNPDAQFLSSISFKEALDKNLGIMDATAYALAQQHKQKIRIFNIFATEALIKAAQDSNFGSVIQYQER
jgi:uridylate kinase